MQFCQGVKLLQNLGTVEVSILLEVSQIGIGSSFFTLLFMLMGLKIIIVLLHILKAKAELYLLGLGNELLNISMLWYLFYFDYLYILIV